jgi:site-specific recombinase XerD
MLRARLVDDDSQWLFPGDDDRPFLATSLNHLHAKVRAKLGLPADCVLHSMRHSFLTRLGEQGVDAFTIMKIAGHASITTSQRYVHPSNDAMERALERLEMGTKPVTISDIRDRKDLSSVTDFTTADSQSLADESEVHYIQ